MNNDSESHDHGGSGDTNPGAPGEQATIPPTNHDLSSASQGASSPAGENTIKDGGPGNSDSRSNHSDTKKVSAEPTKDVRSTSHDTDSTSHDTELGSSDPTKDVCSTSHDTDSASHDTEPGSNETTKDSSAADHDIISKSCDERTTNKNESLARTDVPVDTSVLSSRDTHGLNGDLKSSNHDSSVNRDRETRIDVEKAESDTGKDRGTEAENARLLPNGRTDAEDVLAETVEASISADETEVMEDVTEDFDGRLENLTQSILDLQGKSEAGAYFESVPYVRRRGINKYKPALKTLIPVRGKASKEVLPISNVGCINFCTFGWVTPIVWKVYRKGVDTLKAYRLSELDSAETHAQRLERFWNEELEKRGPEKASFKRVILRAFRTRLLCTLLFITFFVMFSLFNPIFLIRSFLEYLSKEDVDTSEGLAYVAGMCFCELMRSLTISVSWIINYQAGLRIRAGAMTLLYKKILNLKSLKNKTVGELVNLVSNDSQRIFESLAVGPLVLSGPIAMTAGCIYAIYYLGPWALVGCAVFVGFYPFNTFVSRLTTYLRRKGIFITDKRVRMMNELLTCIKLIKMYAWEKPFAKKIADIRLEERKILEKSAMVQSISTGTAILVPSMAATLTFIGLVLAGNDLTAAKAFSFVALLNSMRFVLAVLPYGIKALSEVTVALNRFTDILLMEEMKPSKGSRPPSNIAVEVKDATMAWGAVGDVHPEMPEAKKKQDVKNGKGKQKSAGEGDEEKQTMLKDEATNPMLSDSTAEQSTLNNITFSVPKGKLLGVCGSVGSGKSSIIQAVLGRMERVSGTISVGGSLAYVPQQAWIMNSTARENILFGSPYDEEKYNTVVEACALQTDFDSLITGDLTEIGERGINVSGGQKQRISLARALYSDNDIYLLDDPLSAVDIHIGRHIFTKCISGVLARKSVIFVTHQLQYLPQCDNIIFLKDGQVVESGHHDDLMTQNGEYASLMRVYYKEHTSRVEEGEEASGDLASSQRTAGIERALSCTSSVTDSHDDKHRVLIERAFSVNSKVSTTEEVVAKTDQREDAQKTEGKLIAAEESNKGGLGFQVIKDYVKACGGFCVIFGLFLLFFITIATQNSSSMFLTYWLGQGSGNTTIQVGNTTMISESVSDHPMLSTFMLIYGMTVVAMIIFLVIKGVAFMKMTLKASSNMHDDVFGKILRCPMSFFDTTPIGRIVNRFSADMDEVDVRLPLTAEVFLGNVLHVLFSLGLITYVAPWFLVAIVPLFILFIVIFRIFTQTVREIKRLDMVSRSPLISHITASVQGINTIHAYSRSSQFLKKYCELLNTNSVPFVMFFISNRWLALRLDLISAAVTSITGLIIVLTNDSITPAMAGLALSSSVQMTGLFQFTVRLAIETEARFTSVQRIFDYSKTVEPEAASIIPDKRPGDGWPKKGAITFNKVQMRYRESLPLTLKGVSFKVNPKEKIGIVGRTGSGKSTLGVVLFRLVELSGGSIKIDDLDIGTMGLEDLRSKLSIIPQDPVLFVGTVRYNLDPFNQHADEELWTALGKCHIKDAIAALDQKLDAPVVENGENFSVGERQLLCMARALLRHSKILMLDEATAAIDTETDALVQATLREAFVDCTMLIIAHRLNTVLSCDKILVMDDGKVAEFDRPSVLMSKPESSFRTMLEASEGSGLA